MLYIQTPDDLLFKALPEACGLEPIVVSDADEGKVNRSWLEAIVVIADKPAESWKDDDVTRFELNLSDLSRRFKNLEALQASVKATSKGGFEARRITVTRPDGTEVNKMVWANDEHQAKVDPSIDDIF